MQQALQEVAELLTVAAEKQAELLLTLDDALRQVHEQMLSTTTTLRQLFDDAGDAVPEDLSHKVIATVTELDIAATQLLILVHPQPPDA